MLPKRDLYGKKGSFKYFTRYISETNVFPILLCLKLPQMKGYVKYFKVNKSMNLLVYDKESLKKYIMQYWLKLVTY